MAGTNKNFRPIGSAAQIASHYLNDLSSALEDTQQDRLIDGYLQDFTEDFHSRDQMRKFHFDDVDFDLHPGVFPSDSPLTLTTESVLIVLREHIRSGIIPSHLPIKIADVGTGNGPYSLYLAAKLKMAKVDALDIDPIALSATSANAQRMNLPNLTTIESDLFSHAQDKYDLVVTSLPFARALFDRSIVTRFWCQAPARLETGGTIYFSWASWASFALVEDLIASSGFEISETFSFELTATGFIWNVYLARKP